MMTALTIYLVGAFAAFSATLWLGTSPDGSPSRVGDCVKVGLVWPVIIIVALIARFSDEDFD